MIYPVFTSHHSIGQSILTLETDIFKKVNELQPNGTYLPKKTKEVDFKEPVSIFAIAKQYSLKEVVLVESDISSYWKFYKGCKELGLKPVFGLKLKVVGDGDGEDNDKLTESNIIIFLKNSQAYFDIVPLYSYASTAYQKNRQLTWTKLRDLWSANFALALPFYSSFIARNLMKFNHTAIPEFSKEMIPTCFIQNQGLPFDEMIQEMTSKWCEANDAPQQEVHQVYYFKEEDVMKHLTVSCMRKIPRTNWEKPNLDHYSSSEFSFETYLNKTGGTL